MEVKDPEITLFGKKIAFLENGRRPPPQVVASGEDSSSDSGGGAGAVYSRENSSGSDCDRSKLGRVEEGNEAEDDRETKRRELTDKVRRFLF